jgi:hypothetical protein
MVLFSTQSGTPPHSGYANLSESVKNANVEPFGIGVASNELNAKDSAAATHREVMPAGRGAGIPFETVQRGFVT